ncbi:MAG: hypothetical protein EZS28_043640, partial [Streblomastix strix]
VSEFKISMISDKKICPLRWFKSWFADREPNIPNKAQELRRISHAERYIQADDLSKAIRAVMQSAGINKTYSITSIRAVTITKLLKHNVSSVKVDRFTHHSDTASTVRQYYDKNNNVEARELLCQTELELNNEEDEEQERTLLEDIEHERPNVEQRIPSPVGVLSPGLSHLEFSQSLSSIHITQSQSSIETGDIFQPFLQYSRTPTEVLEVKRLYKTLRVLKKQHYSQVFSILEKSINNRRAHYLCRRNLGQTESSEVQTQSSADEEHEAPMIKEKETDDS